MPTIGFHASHEQVEPRALLEAVALAQEIGFTEAMGSDHFAPWSEEQGESAFSFAWMGAALERARGMRIGQVHAPGQRIHPAISAQAIATLEAMNPGRYWVALGSGENLNERITGEPWPAKPVRNARLRECVHVIRALLAGEEVDHHGLVRVDRARLWTRPATPPPLYATAVSPETAAWAAEWADGLVTVNQPGDALRRVSDAYRDAGGRGPVHVQVHVAWAETEERALQEAFEQWRTNVFPPPLCWDLDSPRAFALAAAHVRPDDVRDSVVVSDSPAAIVDAIGGMLDQGFDGAYVHHVPVEQRAFLERVAPSILAAFSDSARVPA
ncbi:TIGR03885 family FMN-dependent LLM class oxidoreductase [Microcella flavibacter]|uniref:TIGR03885 family FMN-dependent LLM class oxidoreductase n=1 Tax=Microcella flavibacter TaxID=1804990 RepID=UPI0014573B87|nr:TIGR03885 family FMN-dependent LLM class oxidoreductase [Microcella flavibacter]